MTCKELCEQHKAKKNGPSSRYGNGQKRCQICDIFLNWTGIFCPCCGNKLRTRPRKQDYKIKLDLKKSRNFGKFENHTD